MSQIPLINIRQKFRPGPFSAQWFLALALALISSVRAEVVPNRIVPKVDPPQTGLQFTSSTPSPAEITRARVFEEPLVPIGGEPTPAENGALAAALLQYSRRTSPDDFASLTDFLAQHPKSAWRATLLAGLGFEYYTTAHYSLALEAWSKALKGPNEAQDTRGSIVLARAAEELALLYARLGRMTELEVLLKSTGWQTAPGASEKVNLAREALWMMQNRPEVSFRCGPLALQSILRSDQNLLTSATTNAVMEIFNSASTQKGFSLPQVAELSQKIGLNYQMAFRGKGGVFVIPSVVHWKVGHYAAMVRQEGDRYLLQDPTFGNTVWAMRQALEAETSGYFLLPPGKLPQGWRAVDAQEGASVWGKGVTGFSDGEVCTPEDLQAGETCTVGDEFGMPVSSVHLMTANLSIKDTPLAYTPPVGPPVRFTFRYNSRDIYATEGTFGGYYWNGLRNTNLYGPGAIPPPISDYLSPSTKMTHDWISYLVDSPQSPMADVKLIVGGGGARTFNGFSVNSQTFALQEFDQTLLKRTGANSYELVRPDGSKKIFSQSNGSVGASRKVYLTQIVDPAGNAITFTYDVNLRIVAVTDAIGQVTTLTYGDGINLDNRLLKRVTDPFGRFASFDYEKRSITATNEISTGTLWRYITNNNTVTIQYTPTFLIHDYYVLTNMTDILGLSSQPEVSAMGGPGGYGGYISRIVTPYGTTLFNTGQGGGPSGTTRFVETTYPDGSRDRVEYNQNTNGIAFSDPPAIVPQGMNVFNQYLYGRNTFYWSRNACAQGYGDYSKAKIYHWLHSPNQAITAGILESTKEPLERRVWFNYPGQVSPYLIVGSSDQPDRIGRVLDDGTTQLYTYVYNGLGNVINSIDPVGRELSYVYATNGVDLLEVRQTRGANNELLARVTYNSQHRPLTLTDAAGQTTTNTYNARGQLLTTSNPKGETTTFTYDVDGYRTVVDGPLPGTNDMFSATYDAFGRTRTRTDESGYTLTFDYDAMDRLTRVTFPDTTFSQYTYDRLDAVAVLDRAGRQTTFEYDSMRRLVKSVDPLCRTNRLEWCSCGRPKSLTDALGHTTSWEMDVQGRVTTKRYADGSQIIYQYDNAVGRLRQMVDEKFQVTQYAYNRDNTLKAVAYANATVPTTPVVYTWDPNYRRLLSMTDGIGTTKNYYHPVGALGALQPAAVDGPWANDTVTYLYDAVGRATNRSINGVPQMRSYDALGRVTNVVNAIGSFSQNYDGATRRMVDVAFPGGQSSHFEYFPNSGDQRLRRITHRKADNSLISRFTYAHDVVGNITNWVQELGALTETWGVTYDAADRLMSVLSDQGGTNLVTSTYTYDAADNRRAEEVGGVRTDAHFNALNELVSASSANLTNATFEWDAARRLTALTRGTARSEFAYDGRGRLHKIVEKNGGSVTSERRFVWCGMRIAEERNMDDAVVSRFFNRGEQRGGTNLYYFTDHLDSIRELTDGASVVRAEYAYAPYGSKQRLQGDLESTFGFTRLLNHEPSSMLFAVHRVYDPRSARWLSRDPIGEKGGLNLYAYVNQNPLMHIDPLGLSGEILGPWPVSEAEYEADINITIGMLHPPVYELPTYKEASEGYKTIARVADYGGFAVDLLALMTLQNQGVQKAALVFDILELGANSMAFVLNPSSENAKDIGITCAESQASNLFPLGYILYKGYSLNQESGLLMAIEQRYLIQNSVPPTIIFPREQY